MGRFALSTNRPEFLQERHGLDTPPFGLPGNLVAEEEQRKQKRIKNLWRNWVAYALIAMQCKSSDTTRR
jgi:hypothetical protein